MSRFLRWVLPPITALGALVHGAIFLTLLNHRSESATPAWILTGYAVVALILMLAAVVMYMERRKEGGAS